MNKQLIKEFKKTREFSKYNHELETIVYTEEMLYNLCIKRNTIGNITQVLGSHNDTVTEILNTFGTVAALNFADGYEPGGLVLYGATTQEEALCRSSNLYESLILPECEREYYKYNGNNKIYKDGKSSDRIIYTKNVAFFRDSELNWLNENEIKHCDIITCPSPIAGTASDKEIKQRMLNIIKVADDNNVDTLILGCWGCGAFGNKWEHFNKLWLDILKLVNHNCKIVFATRENEFII